MDPSFWREDDEQTGRRVDGQMGRSRGRHFPCWDFGTLPSPRLASPRLISWPEKHCLDRRFGPSFRFRGPEYGLRTYGAQQRQTVRAQTDRAQAPDPIVASDVTVKRNTDHCLMSPESCLGRCYWLRCVLLQSGAPPSHPSAPKRLQVG